jgi:hypothetical protein
MRFDVNKHIVFMPKETPTQTKLWVVWNTLAGCPIGEVKWYTAWRHYCFFPYNGSVFSDRCMKRIWEFVKSQNESRDMERRKIVRGVDVWE